jgi:polysaccharide export outer membrane protein
MKRTLALIAVALSLGGCVSRDMDLPLQSAEELDRVRASNLADYRLGPDDQVALTIYGEPDLTKTYRVGPDGAVDVPLVGPVQAAGLTIDAFARSVQARLAAGYLQNPSVAGTIAEYRPFFILGEVNTPGEYPFRPGMTLDGAVALAGGYTYRAHPDFVIIQGENEAVGHRVTISSALAIRPGDTIRVAERFF